MMYENRARLLCTAEASPQELRDETDGSWLQEHHRDQERTMSLSSAWITN